VGDWLVKESLQLSRRSPPAVIPIPLCGAHSALNLAARVLVTAFDRRVFRLQQLVFNTAAESVGRPQTTALGKTVHCKHYGLRSRESSPYACHALPTRRSSRSPIRRSEALSPQERPIVEHDRTTGFINVHASPGSLRHTHNIASEVCAQVRPIQRTTHKTWTAKEEGRDRPTIRVIS
jgi:hypothetical protein